MSMITCPDCKTEMSSSAPACPKCGKPNSEAPSNIKRVGILLAIGIFFLPVIFSWFTLRKGHTTKAKVISFLWMGMCFAGIIGSQGENKSNNASSITSPAKPKVEQTTSPAKETKDQVMQVNIRDILSAYENNEVGADNKYKGKRIQVTGQVDDIKKDLLDNLYVALGTGKDFEIPQIQAFFDDSMNNKLGQLNKGQQLTIVGKVNGLMMNVLMEDCIIK